MIFCEFIWVIDDNRLFMEIILILSSSRKGPFVYHNQNHFFNNLSSIENDFQERLLKATSHLK